MKRASTPLCQLRKARTFTQADMARLLDIAQPTYARYESGRLVAPFVVQARIAAFFGVGVDTLFAGEGTVKNG